MEFVLRARAAHFEPNADVFVDEGRGDIIVKLELAGADPESLRIAVRERGLTISGRRLDATRLQRGSFVQKEIGYGEFAKRIDLPVAVIAEEVVAEYADGILLIALPVSETEYIPTARFETRVIVKRTLV